MIWGFSRLKNIHYRYEFVEHLFDGQNLNPTGIESRRKLDTVSARSQTE